MTSWKNKLVGAIATGAIVAGLMPVAAFGAGALTVDGSISVTGLQSGDTAKYYQVVTQDEATNAWKLTEAVDSDADGKVDGSELTIADLVITGNPDDAATDKEVITASMANAIAAALTTNQAEGTDMDAFNADGSSTAEVNPGLYMVVAVPSDTNKNTVYKPIFVSADYHNGDTEGAGNTNSIAIAKDETDYQDKSGVFKASDASTVSEIEKRVDDYFKFRLDNWMDEYMPEEKPKLEKAARKTYGLYVVYAILDDTTRADAFDAVEAYLKKQGRFHHLDLEDLKTIIHARDKKWAFIERNFNYP